MVEVSLWSVELRKTIVTFPDFIYLFPIKWNILDIRSQISSQMMRIFIDGVACWMFGTVRMVWLQLMLWWGDAAVNNSAHLYYFQRNEEDKNQPGGAVQIHLVNWSSTSRNTEMRFRQFPVNTMSLRKDISNGFREVIFTRYEVISKVF